MKLWMIELNPDTLLEAKLSILDTRGMLIRASSEELARTYAASYATYNHTNHESWWLDSKHSYCMQLSDDGAPGVLLANFS